MVGIQVVIFLQSHLTMILGQNILLDLRKALSKQFESLPIKYFDNHPAGDIISRCTADVDAVNNMFSAGVVNMIADSLRVIGMLAAMAAVNITISHRLSGIIDAQRIIIVASGRVVQDGPAVELAREDGWFKMFNTLESLGWELDQGNNG